MVSKKRKTKRITLKLKYKIQKKVRDHHKKLKKEKRKHPEKFAKTVKDPGIPKTLPFYDQVMKEVEEVKAAKDKEKEEAKMKKKERRLLTKTNNIGNINELIRTARERGEKFEAEQAAATEQGILTDRSAKAYYREFKKVVEAADVVLEVLDARDPLGCRVPQMENTITSAGKKLILVLNKADLVPRTNLEAWLKYLRREYPTVVFKSSTQLQGSHLAQYSAKVSQFTSELLQTSRCLGADILVQLLKNYCRNKDVKIAITVGVVGLPNTGKSSLINSLKRAKSCGVGSTPGFTKTMQKVQLDSKIQLLDCPGIVMPGGDITDSQAALRNAIKIDNLDDPIQPVEAILARASKSQLMIYYRLPDFHNTDHFLGCLAKRLGKLKKRGIPDKGAAARKVLHDWNNGFIKYYTEPPEVESSEIATSLVTELGKEFDINSLSKAESTVLTEFADYRPTQAMMVESLGPVLQMREESMDGDEDDEEEEMEEDGEENTLSKNVCINMDEVVTSSKSSEGEAKKKRWETNLPEIDPMAMAHKKFFKKVQKKARKESVRNVKRTNELTAALENMTGLEDKTEDYKFEEYFDKV